MTVLLSNIPFSVPVNFTSAKHALRNISLPTNLSLFTVSSLHHGDSVALYLRRVHYQEESRAGMLLNQELIRLIQHPLHGVSLVHANDDNVSTPHSLSLDEARLMPLPQSARIWTLTDSGERYQSTIELSRREQLYQLAIDCEGKGRFSLDMNKKSLTVDWQKGGTGPAHYIQTLAISLFLELNNTLCLHANTLVKDNQAYLFLAPSRTGKSTLTSAMTEQGYQLITDDMAALYQRDGVFVVYPSWPKVRLWPDSAEHFSRTATLQNTTSQRVHARFAKKEITFKKSLSHKAYPIAGMYLLDRDEKYDHPVTISTLPASHGLILLMQNSMLGDAYKALRIDATRMAHIARLLNTLPFQKVTYPTGLKALARVTSELDKAIVTAPK